MAAPEPAAQGEALAPPRTPKEAASWARRAEDEGLSVRATKADGRVKRPGPDGKVGTVIGRLTPVQFRQFRQSGVLDPAGNLATKEHATQRRAVRSRSGGRPVVDVALTIEDFVAQQDARHRAEVDAERLRAAFGAQLQRDEQAATGPKETPRCFIYRSTEHPPPARSTPSGTRSGFSPSKRLYWARRHFEELYATTGQPRFLADARRLWRWELHLGREVNTGWDERKDAETDQYAHMARNVREPTDDEEEHAYELAHGLTPGTLLANEVEEAVAAIIAQWRRQIEEKQRGDGPRFVADSQRMCANPNGCPNPAKGRGTRCAACFEYRRAHRGEERSARLVKRAEGRHGA